MATQRGVLDGQRPLIKDRTAHPRTATATVATFGHAAAEGQAVECQVSGRLYMEQPELVGVAAGSLDGQTVVARRPVNRDRRRDNKRRRPELRRVQPRVEQTQRDALIAAGEEARRKRDRRGVGIRIGQANGFAQRQVAEIRRVAIVLVIQRRDFEVCDNDHSRLIQRVDLIDRRFAGWQRRIVGGRIDRDARRREFSSSILSSDDECVAPQRAVVLSNVVSEEQLPHTIRVDVVKRGQCRPVRASGSW